MKKYLSAALLLILLSYGCSNKRNAERRVNSDSLKTAFAAVNDSVQQHWQVMMQSDSQKVADIKRLLLEVSYTNAYNKPLLDSLQRMQQALPGKRAAMASMDSDKIDQYDFALDSLIQRLPGLLASVPNLDRYPLCAQLSREIDSANNAVLLQRIHYDKFAREYNQLIQAHGTQLKSLGFTDLTPRRLFQLGS